MTRNIPAILLAVLAISLVQTQAASFDNLVVTEARKTVDLYTQLAYQDSFITLKNVGTGSVDKFYFAIENEYINNYALITVENPKDGSEHKFQKAAPLAELANSEVTLFVADFQKPLEAGASYEVKVSVTFFSRMDPLPKRITTTEDQLVVYTDNSNLFTPYKVLTQTTEYKIPGAIKSKSTGGSEGSNSVTYKNNVEISSFSRNPIRIHFVNNYPFVVFSEAVKTITVSHWGNIHIMEDFKLENRGALLKGEFSRVDVPAHTNHNARNALRGLYARLPVHTWGLHYRDEIGNISTSNAYRHMDYVSLQIRPRFSILGGWKAFWDLTYNLPTKYYLYQENDDASHFVLKQKFGFPFESIMAENFTLKVVLPEGARDAKVSIPFEIDGTSEELTFDMLDWQGRKTLVVYKKNALNYHHKEFTVTYTFDNASIFIEPLYLFAAFFAIFAILIVLGRLDLNFETAVTRHDKLKSE